MHLVSTASTLLRLPPSLHPLSRLPSSPHVASPRLGLIYAHCSARPAQPAQPYPATHPPLGRTPDPASRSSAAAEARWRGFRLPRQPPGSVRVCSVSRPPVAVAMVCAKCQKLSRGTTLATPEVKKKSEIYHGSPASSSKAAGTSKSATLGQTGIGKVSNGLLPPLSPGCCVSTACQQVSAEQALVQVGQEPFRPILEVSP